MKQPDSLDIGTQIDVAKYRLRAAKEVTAQQIQTAEQILTLAAEYLQEEEADE